MVRFRNDGIPVRGHSPVLLSYNRGTSTDQEGHRSTTSRMEQAEGDRATDERKVPHPNNNRDMFIASGSLQPGRSTIVYGMLSLSIVRTVKFNERVTV